jgi:protein phosphatase
LQDALSQIVKCALEIQAEEFIQLVEATKQLHCSEKGSNSSFEIIGKLVKKKPSGEALVVGDLHGDLESLIDILKGSRFIHKVEQRKDASMIFLGDYGDRGPYSVEVLYTVLKLKLLHPEQVILLRGNHEAPEELEASPNDLPAQFQTRFGEKWPEAYARIHELFKSLYNAVLVEERYLLVHGGISPQAKTLEDLGDAHCTYPKRRLFEDMLWSDPDETIEGLRDSPRGAGKLFGENVTDRVLKRLNVKILIRGHEPCEQGYRTNHHGKVLTIFSCKVLPYLNSYGAYLDVDLSEKFENAEQLIPYICKF